MATKQLTVHNASVTTMTVEVKTLTIGARQVTQGIFKQLIEEPLIAEDGTLNGVPWGRVNYCPDGNGCGGYTMITIQGSAGRSYDSKHMHIVWQRGDQLFRSTVCSIRALSERVVWRDARRQCAWDDYTEEDRQRHREIRAALAQLPQLFIGG